MLKDKILADLKKTVEDLGYPSTDVVCAISKNPQFGDYSTNVALQLSKQSIENGHQSPEEIANEIVERVKGKGESVKFLEKIEVAKNGFINFFIKDNYLLDNIKKLGDIEKINPPEKILVEYGHVNPLKEIHIGHLRTFILGESLCRIFESIGNEVFRANYQGDIGLHIAKAIWGIKKTGMPLKELSLEEKAQFLGQAYTDGNSAYEAGTQAKLDIDTINKDLYLKDPVLKGIYELTRNWSLEYFEPIYELLGVHYNRCFFESEVFEVGKKLVEDNTGKIFEKSEGAVIFPGEKYGLHNRVFITSAGNPTYEGKEIGIAKMEHEKFNYDKSIHVVASEQEGYFQVVIKAIEMVFPDLKGKKSHLSYGLVDLKQGKMSSRTGNVVTVNDLINMVSEKLKEVTGRNNLEINKETLRQIALGAIKFSYLKISPGPNMVFDLEKSVSLDGDSGPYLQYTYARIKSVLKKADFVNSEKIETVTLEKEERLLLRQMLFFSDIVAEAALMSHPNVIASYLIELAKYYNFFYQKYRIINSDKKNLRLLISEKVADVLKTGLNLLGIETPERM